MCVAWHDVTAHTEEPPPVGIGGGLQCADGEKCSGLQGRHRGLRVMLDRDTAYTRLTYWMNDSVASRLLAVGRDCFNYCKVLLTDVLC